MAEWRFPSNDYGENKGINDSGVAMFRGTPLKSLAREICQNSLDAATAKKIEIDFNMFKIDVEKLPGRNVLKDTFERCLEFWGSQKAQATKEFFTSALKELNKEECTFLRISDFNTTGLTGSHAEINTDWTNLTKSSGASDKKGTAGGSYGIGKFAPFACSYFSTVFYSTYDMKGEEAFQGVTRLVTFKREDEQNTQGTGYYGNDRNTPVYKQLNLDPEFSRKENQFGTDIYIAGYKYSGDTWKKDIIISILDGFLGAIWNEKLEVQVGDTLINKEALGNLIEIYKDDLTGYTDKYYEVLTSKRTVWNKIDFMGMGEVKLGILISDKEAPKRVAMIRQTGMKIMDKDRLSGHVPFVGIMFINGDDINERLRLIENPEHTEWQPDRSKNPLQEKMLLREINSYIKKKIEELVSNSSDEYIDAIGVGNYIPDEMVESDNLAKEEVVSNKVLDVEVKKVKKKATTGKISAGKTSGSNGVDNDADKCGHMELGGPDKEWFHNGGHSYQPTDRPGEESHIEEGGNHMATKQIDIGIDKFVNICVDKDKGKYVLMLIPDKDGIDGVIELFLSAETQSYEAPIVKASLIGGNVSFHDNKIKDVQFKKGQAMRISLGLDYHDYCSLEVKMYAIEK